MKKKDLKCCGNCLHILYTNDSYYTCDYYDNTLDHLSEVKPYKYCHNWKYDTMIKENRLYEEDDN